LRRTENAMPDDDALFQKGMPIRREVLGPEYVDTSMARADEFMMSFQRATTAWAWGDPTLDRKTRSLMNLAMLTALNRAPIRKSRSRHGSGWLRVLRVAGASTRDSGRLGAD